VTSIKDRLRQGREPLSGLLCVIPSAVSVHAIAAAGADWVMIDQEHGPIGPESLHAMVAATAGTACSPWVRVPRADEAWVKPALDAGAEGIVFPLIRSAEDAAACVALTRYPPAGRRGWGPFVAHARWGVGLADYAATKGEEILCGLLVETRAAVDDLERICAVPGVDFLVVASFDLSVELGVAGRLDAPEFQAAVARIERVVLGAGLPLGGFAMSAEQTRQVMARGYRILGHGFDALALGQVVRQAIAWRQG
jgi:4-hydroxy-2-oxoheptanedioate aldolase